MADEVGVSPHDLRIAVDTLRDELRAEFRLGLLELQAELHSEIRRLEEEMRQIGEMIVNAIHSQTLEITAGIATNTAVMESTRKQIEDDFSKTRESTLQIEVGKKVAEARSVRDKMAAFMGDIKSRFDRALITSAQNRELYNVAFRTLNDEYHAKIQTIGAHIFQIRGDDIAPAMKAAVVPFEEAHSLPIEMDLVRLKRRSEQLDQALEILKDARLDEVVSSLERLEHALDSNAVDAPVEARDDGYCVEAVATRSELATKVCAGLTARRVDSGLNIDLSVPAEGLAPYNSSFVSDRVGQRLESASKRLPSTMEVERLAAAAQALRGRHLISEDALDLVQAFLGSGKLRLVEA